VTYSFPSEEEPAFVQMELEGGGKLGIVGTEESLETGSTAIWVYTDDVDAAVAELRDAEVPVISEPEDQPFGERVASVADPDGYTVHIGAEAG
jgi:lactoylglutathione lyase